MNPSNCLIVDSETPLHIPFLAKYRRSFAYYTVKERHPVTLTKIIDHLSQDREQIIKEFGENCREEIKEVIGLFSKLKFELQTNKDFLPLNSKCEDAQVWNEYLKSRTEIEGKTPSYYFSDWLYEECYLYRRFREAFELSKFLKNFDPFQKQKRETFQNSFIAMQKVAELTRGINYSNTKTVEKLFKYLTKVCLWGNRCDLSLFINDAGEKIENYFDNLAQFDNKIILDDTEKLWNLIQNNKNGEKNEILIDFVCDNAGFELFTDICWCDFLMCASLVTRIRIHVKAMPWFVSDATPSDFQWVLQQFIKSDHKPIRTLGERCEMYLENQYWTIESSQFWTYPFDYSQMASKDPKLYSTLSQSKLIVFKGDLNYRKLVGDINWPTSTSMKTALRGFLPANLVSFRTLKSESVVGLSEGHNDKLYEESIDWKISGDYATISLVLKTN